MNGVIEVEGATTEAAVADQQVDKDAVGMLTNYDIWVDWFFGMVSI